MRVAIIGTGNIGTDLLVKVLKQPDVHLVAFVGRRPSTKPLPNGVYYSEEGINFFINNPKCCDLVFDCTDAATAITNAQVFQSQDVAVIDLTPSGVGPFCVPNINCDGLSRTKNVNMITCGGQVSLPLLNYFKSKGSITYTEVVTQISSQSAGMATRLNVDKYIETTEYAIVNILEIPEAKVILNVNPGSETVMQTTVFVKTDTEDFSDFSEFVKKVTSYIPNYTIATPPTRIALGTIMTSVRIRGSGDYLSEYAGNLDIINCAAIAIMCKYKDKNCL